MISLEVVSKAIYLLNFYFGSPMCPATVWIISGLRSRRKNVTAPVLWPNFLRLCPHFWQIKTFRGELVPPSLQLLHHWAAKPHLFENHQNGSYSTFGLWPVEQCWWTLSPTYFEEDGVPANMNLQTIALSGDNIFETGSLPVVWCFVKQKLETMTSDQLTNAVIL